MLTCKEFVGPCVMKYTSAPFYEPVSQKNYFILQVNRYEGME